MKQFLFLFILLFCSFQSFSQSKTVTGTVTNEKGEAVSAASVQVKGRTTGVITDLNGRYSISAVSNDVLQFNAVSYTTQERRVGDQSVIDVQLSSTESNLDDVVVVGYGTQRRENLTGAVTSINVRDNLQARPITDVGRGLQGVVPGLTIQTSSGDIGTNPEILLRGLRGSLSKTDSKATPLILVDNVEFPDLKMLNPDDIESISVLKDAASASIYGTRAAWGVILITTKKGKKGVDRTAISYTNNFAWSRPTVLPEIAPAAEGAEMAFEAYRRTDPNRKTFPVIGYSIDSLAIVRMREWESKYGFRANDPNMIYGEDFEVRDGALFFYRPWDPNKLFLKNYAPQQTHNLSFSGSSAKTAYNLGLGYLNQDGILKIKPDRFQRYNIDLGVTSSITNWLDARAKIIFAKSDKAEPYNFQSATYDPWYYMGRWPRTWPYGLYEGKPWRNTITEVEAAHMNELTNNLTRLNIGGTFKLARGLTFDMDYIYASTAEHEERTGGAVFGYDFWAGGAQYPYRQFTNSATHNRAQWWSRWNNRNAFKGYATYVNRFRDHNIKLIVGTDVEVYKYGSQYSERRALLSPDMGVPGLATGDQFVDATKGHWATLGYFGRINYDYKSKYLLELNGRYDGSSRFPLNSVWGFFPSMSAGWVISNENFMETLKPTLSFLKLRGSWGSIGNQDIGDYRFLRTMNSYNSNWVIGNVNMATVGSPGLVSPDLTWETISTVDIGLDARFFNNSLGFVFDWYRRTTSDMISSGIVVPSTLGTTAPVLNFGEMQTKGWELSVDYNGSIGKDFNFNILATLSDFKEVITKFPSNNKPIDYYTYGARRTTYYEGKILGDIYGYETDRFFTKDDFQQDANGNLIIKNGKYVLKEGIASQALYEAGSFFYGPGDIKYKDLNGDGKITYGTNTVDSLGDQVVIGNNTPRYQYGFRLGMDWKGIDFSMFVQGVGMKKDWVNGPIFIPGYRPNEAWYAHQLDYWTPENVNAFYPRPTDFGGGNPAYNFLPQTKYILNMAYARFKNITLGYSLPQELISKIRLTKARVYFSGENLITFDKMNGIPLDPEVNYTTNGAGDWNSFGRVYPYRKTYSFGLQITL